MLLIKKQEDRVTVTRCWQIVQHTKSGLYFGNIPKHHWKLCKNYEGKHTCLSRCFPFEQQIHRVILIYKLLAGTWLASMTMNTVGKKWPSNNLHVVVFAAKIEVVKCPKDPREWRQVFEIYPVGINEKVLVDLEMMCQCDCEKPGHRVRIPRFT